MLCPVCCSLRATLSPLYAVALCLSSVISKPTLATLHLHTRCMHCLNPEPHTTMTTPSIAQYCLLTESEKLVIRKENERCNQWMEARRAAIKAAEAEALLEERFWNEINEEAASFEY